MRFRGRATSCFLDINDRPSIDTLVGDPTYGEGIATWCRLIENGDQLGVLTNLGFTNFTGGTLGGWLPTAVEVRPVAVGRVDEQMFAVLRRDDRVELQPLPTGEPTLLRMLGSGEQPQAMFDGDRLILSTVKSIFDNGSSRFELTSTRRSLE